MRAKLGAMDRLMSLTARAHAACSRDEPQPKFLPRDDDALARKIFQVDHPAALELNPA